MDDRFRLPIRSAADDRLGDEGLRPERLIDERLTMDAIAGDSASPPRETGEGQHLVRQILPERK